jgi:hypothetical protein
LAQATPFAVLRAENCHDDDSVERRVSGPGACAILPGATTSTPICRMRTLPWGMAL